MPLTLNSASFFDTEQETTRLVWSKNIVFLDLQAPTNWTTFNTYFVELEIGVESVGTLVSFPQPNSFQIEEPDENGNLVFEIQQFIDDYELIKVPVPNYNSTQVEVHQVPKFYVKIFENIDGVRTQIEFERMLGPTGVGSPLNRWTFLAIQAGLDRENFNYQLQKDWIFATDKRKFLTNIEDRKSSHKLTNEFLYWYGVLPSRADLDVLSKIYYSDGTEETVTLFEAALQGSNIQIIPTRYDLIKQKSTQPLKEILAWSVYVAYNTNRASEYFRYELPDQPNREGLNFLYRNSFGCFDMFICTGDFEKYLESESSYASIKDKPNYEVSEAQKLLISQVGKRGGTANSAFLNRQQADARQDFILSKEILIEEKNQFIPVTIEKNKQIYNLKNSSLLGYNIEYEHAHKVRLFTNNFLRPKRGEVVSPPSLPKFYIKNTGPSGYVRVEYESTVVDVAPNTEEAIEISENISVKVTWSIVNQDTGLLDASIIDISFPNYAFPSRFDTATFDSVIQDGNIVVAIPDESTIKKARSFTFIMPNTDYFAKVNFKKIQYKDIDFENPMCTDNITDGSPIVTMRDTQNLVSYVQATPSQRALLAGNKAVFEADSRAYLVRNTSIPMRNYFFVGSINRFAPSYPRGLYSRTLDLNLPYTHITSLGSAHLNMILGTGRIDGKFGLYGLLGTNASSGLPIPDFDFDATFLDENVMMNTHATFSTSWEARNQLFAKGQMYNYPNDRGVVETSFKIGDPQTSGKVSVLRTLGTEVLTENENEIFNTKMRTKYNA